VYLSTVLSGRILAFGTSLLAITFIAGSRLLPADDAAPASSSGNKTVQVRIGGKTVPIRVQETGDPYRNVSSTNTTGKYDPQRIFSNSSSLADKKFFMPTDFGSQGTSAFKPRDQDTFITKSYIPDASSTVPNLNSKVKFASATGYDRSAAGFDKNYAASAGATEQNRTAVLGTTPTAEEQGRSAILGDSEHGEVLAANSMAGKQYLGPGAQKVPDGVVIHDNVTLSRMSDVPNRPLSIDEVRDLINHGTKPDFDTKPEEPSKPLNDPNYKPKPLRDDPSPESADDKTDAVPPPGTIANPQAAPENSEPLPQP
jgi:hypothetical protein